jgi:putative ABC transport system ATP-binding protein
MRFVASIIKVQNLRKIYRVGKEKVVALDDICLEIGEGEMCCIVGASGSGKSTLLNQLAGLEKPTKGRVLIGKHDISAMTEDELADFRQQHLGFIFQSYNLLPSMTAAENVALPLMFKGMGKKQREKLARKELKKMGLLSRANHKPTEMSGGQQQRVGIARAFVAKPKVIFADEPTGNLDSTTSRQVLYSMLEMAKSYGITFVMVTHEKELAYCGDRIVTIKDGRVLDNVLLGEDEKAENRRRLFGDVTSGDIAEAETTVAEGKKPAARQAKAVAAAVAEKVNQESM